MSETSSNLKEFNEDSLLPYQVWFFGICIGNLALYSRYILEVIMGIKS